MEDEQIEEREERNGAQSSSPQREQEKIKHEGGGMVAVGDAGSGRRWRWAQGRQGLAYRLLAR